MWARAQMIPCLRLLLTSAGCLIRCSPDSEIDQHLKIFVTCMIGRVQSRSRKSSRPA